MSGQKQKEDILSVIGGLFRYNEQHSIVALGDHGFLRSPLLCSSFPQHLITAYISFLPDPELMGFFGN